MPELARKYNREQYYYNKEENPFLTYTARPRGRYGTQSGAKVSPIRPYQNPIVKSRQLTKNTPKRKQRKKTDSTVLLARLLGLSILTVLSLFVLPSGFMNISKSIFTQSPYPNIKADYNKILNPTINYVNNNLFLNNLYLSSAAAKKKALMKPLPKGNELPDLETSLRNILPMYPDIHPAIFVMDYDTGNFADINGEELFSAASIIKIPVLLQLFKSIEANQFTIFDSMELKDYYRAEGSGELQFKAENSVYTLDYLAKVMITNSDNSATNMLMSKMGGMPDVNRGIRDWGLKHTSVQKWLPDMNGENYTTARDLAVMLYNIENKKFLSDSSRSKIYNYMSHVKNNRLIQAGLGEGATFVHKTGDIGKMLGDAGIVTTPNGKKYIVIIMANRPYNSPQGKDFIVKASEIIYNYMVVK